MIAKDTLDRMVDQARKNADRERQALAEKALTGDARNLGYAVQSVAEAEGKHYLLNIVQSRTTKAPAVPPGALQYALGFLLDGPNTTTSGGNNEPRVAHYKGMLAAYRDLLNEDEA